MTSYAILSVGTVLRCPRTGDLYTRVSDGEVRDWLAVYVATASRIAADLWAGGDAVELLATADLPKTGLVLLAPVTATKAVVVERDLSDEIEALALLASAAEIGAGVTS